MSKIFRKRGIVLHKIEQGLDSNIFFLTSKGIIKIKAKGALKIRSKLKGVIETFDFSRLEFVKGKNSFILTGGTLLKRPLYLRTNLEKTLFLKVLAELTLTLVKDLNTKKVYLLWLYILKTLKQLNKIDLWSFFGFSFVHLLMIEGLFNLEVIKNLRLNFKEKSLIKDVSSLSYSFLRRKNYSPKDYKRMIFILVRLVGLEDEFLKPLNLFLKSLA